METMRRINRVSQLFQPSNVVPKCRLRKIDVPSKSYELMTNTGIISHSTTGMYAFLPLGLKALQKLIKIVDKEMMHIGGQQIYLPALTSTSLWHKTSRMVEPQPELFLLKDRHGKQYLLSPTFEESVTNMISSLGCLKRDQLPLRLYQISSKWRDEIKPRLGLLRSREFIMKDMYTFDLNAKDAANTYEIVNNAYESILNHIGIPHIKLLADTGTIGGSISHEFHYLSDIGEDVINLCTNCNHYESRIMKTESRCPSCKKPLKPVNTVEIGHTFLLGKKYSEPLKAIFIDNNNKRQFLEMGCYGLGLSRILATAIEVLSTDLEIRWPLKLAPYSVCIIPPKEGSKEEASSALAYDLYNQLQNANIDVIVDDRIEETIGKRFIYARQSGYPFVIVIGKKSLDPIPLIELHNMYQSSQINLEMNSIIGHLKNIL